jgi:hypothetical protein
LSNYDPFFGNLFFCSNLLQFVIHECPQRVTSALFKEAMRLLRPGGVVAMCDNDPKSRVIQGLPPAIFTLMK